MPRSRSADALAAARSALAAAAAGVQFVSESEAPFAPVVLPPEPGPAADASAPPSAPPTANEIRRRFDLGAGVPVAERTLDGFFRYGVEDVDPADAAARAAAPAVRALREAVRRLAPDARAYRAGDGPEVRYLVVGRLTGAPGALAGVETVGYES